MRIDLAWDEPNAEPNCERCGNPESWCGCKPLAACPECGEEQEDAEGWGVLACVACGFCRHAIVVEGACTWCGRRSYAA